jgi:hypothetical protein
MLESASRGWGIGALLHYAGSTYAVCRRLLKQVSAVVIDVVNFVLAFSAI